MKDIEAIRKKLNLTQTELAQELGISKRSYINRIENESDWKIGELIKLSNLCNDDITVKCGVNTYSINIRKA